MLLASSLAFHPERPDRVVDRALGMGFVGVEFLCEPPWHPSRWSPHLVRRVRREGAELTLHTPVADVNLLSPHPGGRRFASEEVGRTVALAAELGASSVTFHIGYKPLAGVGGDPPWGPTLGMVERLRDRARRRGVSLCLENDPRLPGACLWDLGEFARTLAALDLCGTLDLGHAWISHGTETLAFLPVLVPHLQILHLHDNRGASDDHLALGEGESRLEATWEVLRDVPSIVIEVKDREALERSLAWWQARGRV